ncbi:Kanadaptin [Dissophora globulifera]|uniref:Kanadaptin n=1 Tax=Dissophora globulifera TaxID=979702 RepID=A0A9P6RHD5_9FUNG|nr:Kanadaptin [Dissophora globulifera]
MPFAVPQVPDRTSPQGNGGGTDSNTAPAEGSAVDSMADTKGHANNDEQSSKPVFAMPMVPTKKSSTMPPPPPPPVFPKDQGKQSASKDDVEERIPSTEESKPRAPNAPPLKYQKPAWSGYPNQQFFFEVIKNGIVVERIRAPEKEFLTIGRLPMCDLEMEHPSLSRYHAVVQFKSNGECFIYDLNSSHGTKLNKSKILPGMHVALKPGDQLRFGESTRIYLFQTEEAEDQEEEERKLVAAMIERQTRSREAQRQENDDQEQEFNWGMQEDAVDEDEPDDTVRRAADPDASYRLDPKKALRNYLESRGYSCEYEVEEGGPQHAREYTARIRLPIETAMGPVYGEATAGKKRDAEREAALDACIQLDTRGMLGQKSSGEGISQGKSSRRDTSDDDDDDDFYDRTEKKKKNVAKTEQKADTHESLLEKLKTLQSSMAALETRLEEHDATEASRKRLEESGDLDAYMALLEKSGGDSKAKMQQDLAGMKKEERRLQQLVEFTKPVDFTAKISTGSSSVKSAVVKDEPSPLPRNGKRQSDSPAVVEEKKARVLGPSLPPPSS